MSSSIIKIDPRPTAVLNKQDAIHYVGSAELFELLEREHDLIPVYENRSRRLYRITAIDAALLELELLKRNSRQKGNRIT